MTEVRPDKGQAGVGGCIRQAGQTHQELSAGREPSFRQLYELHRALEEIVSAAARDGTAIRPALSVDKLLSDFALVGVSRAELRDAINQAAARAGVRVCKGC